MKKIIASILLVCCVIISGCTAKLNGYTKISYNELLKKIENGETFPLVIGSSECSACANYEIVMNQFISKNQVEVYMIDIVLLSEDEYKKLKSDTSFSGTPTTVFYKDGELTSFYNRIDGSASMDEVKSYFRSNGYIE